MKAYRDHRRANGSGRERGFTIVELLITVTVLVVVLAGLGGTATLANRSMQENDRRAEACEKVQRFFQRIAQFTRSGVLSTYRVEATAADVSSGRAGAVGEWIDPVDGERRPVAQLRAADGILAMSANSLTDPIVLRFRLDEAEDPERNPGAVAGADDDGDGLIDEGEVAMTYSGTEPTMLRGIEALWLVVDGPLLTVQVRTARTVKSPVQFSFEQGFSLRNN